MVAGLVLAAGAGRRFGDEPKQLAELGGAARSTRASGSSRTPS
jgi:CTP:molybdopterin cytidylyltransferase MocA